MLADLVWRAALLGAVFVADLTVFVGLCRDELGYWRSKQQHSRMAERLDYTTTVLECPSPISTSTAPPIF
jgi:hypothetical protein